MIKSILFSIVFVCIGIVFLGSCNNQTTDSPEKETTEKFDSTNEQAIDAEPIGSGQITTKVDGMDVKKVNLWSSATSDRSIVCSLTHMEEVKILDEVDPYYLVESMKDKSCRGYCMKGFIVEE